MFYLKRKFKNNCFSQNLYSNQFKKQYTYFEGTDGCGDCTWS